MRIKEKRKEWYILNGIYNPIEEGYALIGFSGSVTGLTKEEVEKYKTNRLLIERLNYGILDDTSSVKELPYLYLVPDFDGWSITSSNIGNDILESNNVFFPAKITRNDMYNNVLPYTLGEIFNITSSIPRLIEYSIKNVVIILSYCLSTITLVALKKHFGRNEELIKFLSNANNNYE